MANKLFISFLGKNAYGECRYAKDDFESKSTLFIQEATLDYWESLEKWTSDDVALILLTKDAHDNNWVNKKVVDSAGVSQQRIGLEERLKKRNSAIQIKTILINDGNNEAEIWSVFTEIFNELNTNYKGVDLYFELTHSFRYLPMLFLVLMNYAKFLSDIHVKGITYGNYEARNREKNVAPILNLLPLSVLQDWTYAAANYLNNGRAEDLRNLANVKAREDIKNDYINNNHNNKSAKDLNKFTEKLNDDALSHLLCRGSEILNATYSKELWRLREKVESGEYSIPALKAVIDKVCEQMVPETKSPNPLNTIFAAKWCLDRKLYQQAITLLEEGLISYICEKDGQLNYKLEADRNLVGNAFKLHYDLQREIELRKVPGIESNTLCKDLEEPTIECLKKNLDKILIKETPCSLEKRSQQIVAVSRLLDLSDISDLVFFYEWCRKTRNDMNHAGFLEEHSSSKDLPNHITECINSVLGYFQNEADFLSVPVSKQSPIFINLSNHKSKDWSDKQKSSALEIGEIKDIEFPAIPETADEEEVTDLVWNYVKTIESVAPSDSCVVHIMGEMTFTYQLVSELKSRGYRCVASTTSRNVSILPNGDKQVHFDFCRFRDY